MPTEARGTAWDCARGKEPRGCRCLPAIKPWDAAVVAQPTRAEAEERQRAAARGRGAGSRKTLGGQGTLPHAAAGCTGCAGAGALRQPTRNAHARARRGRGACWLTAEPRWPRRMRCASRASCGMAMAAIAYGSHRFICRGDAPAAAWRSRRVSEGSTFIVAGSWGVLLQRRRRGGRCGAAGVAGRRRISAYCCAGASTCPGAARGKR